jgi:SulP family sulfate permease
VADEIPADLHKKVAIYDIAGPLFFGAAQKAMANLGTVAGDLKVLVMRLDRVPVMDATGLVALESAIATLTGRGCLTILTGLQRQPAELVARAGFQQRPWRLDIRPDLAAGLAAAREAI